MKELNNNKTPLVKTLKSNSLYLLIMNNASAIIVKIKMAKNIIAKNKKYTQDCLSKGPK
jgi:hypothetical protein